MKKNKVSILGHFAFDIDLHDGQTVKTRIVSDEIVRHFGKDNVSLCDTYGGIKKLPKQLFSLLKAMKRSKNLIIMPAHNGVRFFAPLAACIKKMLKCRLHYVVIGGWLPEFVAGRSYLKNSLNKFDGIYVETNTMKHNMEKLEFNNIYVVPNCKNLDILSEDKLEYHVNKPYKLCTFSRVMPEKGIEDAINAVKYINEKYKEIIYTLDIYGPVDASYKESFQKIITSSPDYISYKGIIDFDKTTEVLKSYYMLLFPTTYSGEGFAGTIIDAFSAGVPVVATNWRYNSEIISSGSTGIIYDTEEPDRLLEILDEAINSELINDMKLNCIAQAHSYVPKNALKPLFDKLK